MNELDRIMEIIEAAGFSHTGKISMDTVELRDEVRDMCRNGNCGKYARNWSCPPGCGTLDQCRQQLLSYKIGILVQTVGEIEDSMDWEGMKSATKKLFLKQRKSFAGHVRDFFLWELEPAPCVENVPTPKSPADSQNGGFPLWKPMESWSVISVPETR